MQLEDRMNTLFVLLDTSTKRSSRTSKYGESTIAWVARWNKPTSVVVRSGIEYVYFEGPNKVFYDGIIRVLQSCFYLCHPEDKLVIFGDCKLVIDQINSVPWTNSQMLPFWKQVQKLAAAYRCPVEFIYMPRANPLYDEVDQMAKRSRGFFKNHIKNNE